MIARSEEEMEIFTVSVMYTIYTHMCIAEMCTCIHV